MTKPVSYAYAGEVPVASHTGGEMKYIIADEA